MNILSQDMLAQRDFWLSSSDEELLRFCRVEAFKASGNGGQKVNKTSSAVRVIHNPTSISATDSESRSQHENKHHALRKLRMQMAFELRCLPAELKVSGDIPSLENPLYPLFAAKVLDHLVSAAWDMKTAAANLGFSTSKLLKLSARDSQLWQFIQKSRETAGLHRLRPPE